MRRRILVIGGIAALTMLCLAFVSLPPRSDASGNPNGGGIHPPGKLSWFGGHARSGIPIQLVVRATRLDTAGPSRVWVGREQTLSWGFARMLAYGWNDATLFDLPASGRWLLVATLDQDWGCFVYSL